MKKLVAFAGVLFIIVVVVALLTFNGVTTTADQIVGSDCYPDCDDNLIMFGDLAGQERCVGGRSLVDAGLVLTGECHLSNYLGYGCFLAEDGSVYGDQCDPNKFK